MSSKVAHLSSPMYLTLQLINGFEPLIVRDVCQTPPSQSLELVPAYSTRLIFSQVMLSQH